MNTTRIKQIFHSLAKAVTESLDSESRDKRSADWRIPTVRRGKVLTERASEAYIESVDEITAIVGVDGSWSRFTVDDLISEHIDIVLDAAPDQRSTAIRSQGDEVVRRFGQTPSCWIVDLLVYGMDSSCSGLKFGRLTFFSEEVSLDDQYRSGLADLPSGREMFARLETIAIDGQSAIHRAAGVLDQHLSILNALFSLGIPSLIRVSRVNDIDRTYTVHRVGNSIGHMGSMGFQGINTKVPLMRHELEYFLNQRLGGRIVEMLSSPENEFTGRVLSAYGLAGSACVDPHPERRFLMFAIALESAVLCGTSSQN